ncbi:MAG: glycosyltransferase [Pseudomonadota bacterium]
MTVFIVVTHLLGTGHLARALVLARAFTAAGHKVTIASGGMPVPHLDTNGLNFLQLAPLRSDGTNFSRLLDRAGSDVTEVYLTQRRNALCSSLERTSPDIVITELFPFGRRSLSGEFEALLNAAKQLSKLPLICASVRDILAPPSKPAKTDATREMIARYYDAILVHSDPDITPLELSWPVTDDLAEKIHYTGFVTPAPSAPHAQSLGRNEIIVSAGGGGVGHTLYETAVSAARTTPEFQWRILVGGSDANDQCEKLQAKAPQNVIVEPARRDFRNMLHHAQASVSMCGYNTALDILQAGTPAVFIPFDAGSEVEQSLRAGALAALDGVEVLASRDLSPATLNNAIAALLKQPSRPPRTAGLDGAERSVDTLKRLYAGTQHAG